MGAQAMAQETSSEDVGVREIIVTAQKREQLLQDVPVAITALDQTALEANRITDIMDLGAQAPNLNVRETAGGIQVPTFTMRGSVTYGSVSGQDKTIGIYLDGVYMGSAYGSAFDLPDLQRIEVLRGPQGTLFGRNSTAGAISIVTRDPTGELGARQQFTYGNYAQFRSSTRVDLPQVGPFSASISYTHSEREGDVKNLAPRVDFDFSAATDQSLLSKIQQRTVKRFGDKNSESIFAAVKFEPSDDFTMTYKFDWNELRYTPEASQLIAFIPDIYNYISPGFGSLIQGLLASDPPVSAGQSGPATAKNILSIPGYIKNQGHNVTATYYLTDNLTVKNIFGYRKAESVVAASYGGYDTIVPSYFGPLGNSLFIMGSSIVSSRVRQWSDEVQLNYNSEPLTVTAGAIYFNIKTQNGAPSGLVGQGSLFTNFFFQNAAGQFVVPGGQDNRNYFYGRSYAAYAQVEGHLTPQLDVLAGYRITRDMKDGHSLVYSTRLASQLEYLYSPYRDTRSTYMFGVNYKPTDDILLYAKYSTGFVSGGAVAYLPYAPETVKAWEGGVKAELLDRRLRANLALFKSDYKHLQANASGRTFPTSSPLFDPDVGTLLIDEGDLNTKGFELELTAVPTRGLTFNAAVGYTDVKFTRVNQFLAQPHDATVRPKWTSNLSAQYDTMPFYGDAYMMFRVDASYRSKSQQLSPTIPTAPAGAVVAYSNSLTLVNGRVALRDIKLGGGKAELALWGRNIFNQTRPDMALDLQVGIVSSSYTDRRTYGVDLTFDF
ncbi:TonB-dependent receptor [Novosphingobium malaysiense]|uniref:TonB-dependent receptor n=1 Tax=Novosphingobium malaysiense TaxID=1348853 RepID=A0A0B1ZD17_9SPHN|nr:TonB-dependent receptor [Novosphingobium malaysiense]KHK88949.1 hypothetical protein LK12_22885 [Novosphingobium malaysiense]